MKFAARDRLRPLRVRLILRRPFARQFRDRRAPQAHRKHRLAAHAIQHEQVPRLPHARDHIDAFSLARDRHEIRWRAHIEVPNVVPHILKMPEAFPRQHIEREHTVAEQIIPQPPDADHVGPRRAQRHERHAASIIDREPAPAIRPCLRPVPRFGTKLSAACDRVKPPEFSSAPHIETVDITR